MKKFLNSFCAVFVLAVCLTAGCKAPSGGDGSGSSQGGGNQSVVLATGIFTQTGYKKIGTQKINGTDYDIVTFGNWPQSLKADGVTVSSTATNVNGFVCYKGGDNEWYVKYGTTGNDKYYKVEPIKWRVLTSNYDHDGNPSTAGKKLLHAENTLINKAYHANSNNYENSSVRAYLTGDFYATAFTQEEQNAIATTTVINNARSTNPDSNATLWNNGENQYASDNATSDKIFLLSEQEVTKAEYGFGAYNEYKGDGTHNESTRIRMTTAFAKESGAYQNGTSGYGGYWWLRSPFYNISFYALRVFNTGNAYNSYNYVYSNDMGVVPALCIN